MNDLSTTDLKRGFVYAVRDDAAAAVKIGFSCSPRRRIQQLQTAHALPLRELLVIACVASFEKSMHSRFSSRRLSGEWFDDSDLRVSAVVSLMQRCTA